VPNESIFGKPVATYRGGYAKGPFNSSTFLRFVRLDIYASGLRLSPAHRILAFSVPTWEWTFDWLVAAEVGRSRTGVMGIRFRTVDNATMTFRPTRGKLDQVVASLRQAGVDVRPR
jgi:hypothetical protein